MTTADPGCHHGRPRGSATLRSGARTPRRPAAPRSQRQKEARPRCRTRTSPRSSDGSPGHGAPQSYAYPYAEVPQQNNLALLSLILSIVGLATGGLTAIGGIILGHMVKKQIKRTGETGVHLATWGLVVGYVIVGLIVLSFVFWFLVLFVLFGGLALGC